MIKTVGSVSDCVMSCVTILWLCGGCRVVSCQKSAVVYTALNVVTMSSWNSQNYVNITVQAVQWCRWRVTVDCWKGK